jgi:hypothetical protein
MDITGKLNEMVGFAPDEEIELFAWLGHYLLMCSLLLILKALFWVREILLDQLLLVMKLVR